MNVSARLSYQRGSHSAIVRTEDREQSLSIPPRGEGFGSRVNGGELLFLALATCYCNDIYREAQKRSIEVTGVEVEVSGEFGAEGEGARNIHYHAKVESSAPAGVVQDLIRHTDALAEIHNTLRASVPVQLVEWDVPASR